MKKFAVILIAAALVIACGCVERKLTVTSTPPGAKVYLDDHEKGETPVTFRFDFYGQRTFTLKKDGYRITEEVRKVRRPIYELPVLDVVADLTPIPLKDHKKFHFELEPVKEVDTGALLDRARRMKARTEGKPVPEKTKPTEKPKPAEAGKKPAGTPPTEAQPTPTEAKTTPEK